MSSRDHIVNKIRRHLLGGAKLDFVRTNQPPVAPDGPLPLYLHIPYCRSTCHYCPYCKSSHDPQSLAQYMRALSLEIDLTAQMYGRRQVPSVYIGGGTPTLADELLSQAIGHLSDRFDLSGRIAIETTPAECTGAKLTLLRNAGVNMLSIGVQSFDDRLLRTLGRSYRSGLIGPAIARAVDAGFETVNLDLMFALPDQSDAQLRHDIHIAVGSGANHLTFYPLFRFPHTYRRKPTGVEQVRMPRLWTRWRQFRVIEHLMRHHGFERVSVWAYRRGTGPRYSSVTRPNYLGLGVSSISHTGGAFTANTFSVEQYIQQLAAGRPATMWRMTCNAAMERYHALYWRLYETVVPLEDVTRWTQSGDDRPRRWLEHARWLGLVQRQPHGYLLTRRGAFWIHLLQNHFALDSIDRLWAGAQSLPVPHAIAV